MACIPRIEGIWSIVLGTLEVQEYAEAEPTGPV